MATVIHEHTRDEGGSSGVLLALIILLVMAFIFIFYGLPAVRSSIGAPQVNVPDKIDVNLNSPQK
ncbi:MAG: hypothetical protein HZC02_00380 [Candidatus Levybacteria bacterium]|nr:hypothetical protein [Candidatus Levybacteria bacterium]